MCSARSVRVPPSFRFTSIALPALSLASPMMSWAPVALYRSQVHSDQSLDHLSFAFANYCHVDRTRTSDASKFARVVDKIRNLGTPDFILAGKAVSVEAGPTNPASFDHRSLLSRLRQVPGEVFSTLAAPDDYVLVGFHWHVLSPCPVATEANSTTRLQDVVV